MKVNNNIYLKSCLFKLSKTDFHFFFEGAIRTKAYLIIIIKKLLYFIIIQLNISNKQNLSSFNLFNIIYLKKKERANVKEK